MRLECVGGCRGVRHVEIHEKYLPSGTQRYLRVAQDSTKAQDLPGPSISFIDYLVAGEPFNKTPSDGCSSHTP